MVKAGIQNVVEVKRPHGVHSESPGSLLVSPAPPSHASVGSHCCDAEEDQCEAHPPSAKGTKKIWAVAYWYFLGTPEPRCSGGDGQSSSYREGPGSGFPTILVDLQGGEGQQQNFT